MGGKAPQQLATQQLAAQERLLMAQGVEGIGAGRG
jgi:hypothetical protein